MSDRPILYEFPCNEKIRMYLRLEMLFRRFNWLAAADDPCAHHAALSALFELTDATGRSDLKAELLQTLDRAKSLSGSKAVCRLGSADAVSERASDIIASINAVHGRFGQNIREHEWLQLIRARQNIPGGTGAFDMPLLHYWLNMAPEDRRRDLLEWTSTLTPICDAVDLILSMIRADCIVEDYTASCGRLQLPTTGRNYQLVRLWVDASLAFIPEVSVNKYMLWVRFSETDSKSRLHASKQSVSFRMGLCC